MNTGQFIFRAQFDAFYLKSHYSQKRFILLLRSSTIIMLSFERLRRFVMTFMWMFTLELAMHRHRGRDRERKMERRNWEKRWYRNKICAHSKDVTYKEINRGMKRERMLWNMAAIVSFVNWQAVYESTGKYEWAIWFVCCVYVPFFSPVFGSDTYFSSYYSLCNLLFPS